jgi:hypothetical protein
MTRDEERQVRRKRKVLTHAKQSGNIAKSCRYFGVSRSTFYRWRSVYLKHGDECLINKKPILSSTPNRTPGEIAEKILYLRKKRYLGPMRTMWYITRYHSLKVSDVTISRVLKRNGVSRLPINVGRRKVYTKRNQK